MIRAPKIRAGVMGWPVAHSLSPRLHGHWLAEHGIEDHEVTALQALVAARAHGSAPHP